MTSPEGAERAYRFDPAERVPVGNNEPTDSPEPVIPRRALWWSLGSGHRWEKFEFSKSDAACSAVPPHYMAAR